MQIDGNGGDRRPAAAAASARRRRGPWPSAAPRSPSSTATAPGPRKRWPPISAASGSPVDVTDARAVGRGGGRGRRAAAPLRICVNCAGIGLAARIVGRDGALSLDLFEAVLRVNLFGTYVVMSHAAKAMMATGPTATGERGVIVNTASAAYQDGQIGSDRLCRVQGRGRGDVPACRARARPVGHPRHGDRARPLRDPDDGGAAGRDGGRRSPRTSPSPPGSATARIRR